MGTSVGAAVRGRVDDQAPAEGSDDRAEDRPQDDGAGAERDEVVTDASRSLPPGAGSTREGLSQGRHLFARYPGVDEQHASRALHDNRVALQELALMGQHAVGDLPQHGSSVPTPSPDPTDSARGGVMTLARSRRG